MTRPIVFLTDYGVTDEFVGICHGVMARIAPDARVIDLTHGVPRQDVRRGAVTLGRAVAYMPAGAIYVAVVDPGVGSERRALVVRADDALLVGPDNGILSLAWQRLGGPEAAVEITSDDVLLDPMSRTFHGRDVFAPVAAHLANGLELDRVGPSVDLASLIVIELPGPMVAHGAIGARVLGVDGFGNVQLNVEPEHLTRAELGHRLTVLGHEVSLVGTFTDVPEGALAAIVDSQGHIALVVNRGNASEMLGLGEGSPVVLE
jgi:S-adenosyl-L-methionine hydrolase (adenosine-forming)